MENIQASFTVAKIKTYLTISPNLSKKKYLIVINIV